MLKKLLGIAPRPTEDGAFEPSPLSLRLATSPVTDYAPVDFARRAAPARRRVLMVCTQERFMTMANGTRFDTGNHPVETLVPMLHLQAAGFETEVWTLNGGPVRFEEWAMPRQDTRVMALHAAYRDRFARPHSLAASAARGFDDLDGVAAVFIPGGHGAMLGLPESEDLGRLLRLAPPRDWFVLALCHGPAALLAARIGVPGDQFVFRGHRIAAFPDAVDAQTPWIGYMPGPMPWRFGQTLQQLGVTLVNRRADERCELDRRLVTGASPKAAQPFGVLAVRALLGEAR